jgi:hypothetical protein
MKKADENLTRSIKTSMPDDMLRDIMDSLIDLVQLTREDVATFVSAHFLNIRHLFQLLLLRITSP